MPREDQDQISFLKKYVREDEELAEVGNIHNIQSIQSEVQAEDLPARMPNTSFDVKLINSDGRHENDDFQPIIYSEVVTHGESAPIEAEMVSVTAVEEVALKESNPIYSSKETKEAVNGCYQTNASKQHQERPPNQKIKLFSSNKSKKSTSSNKSSPAVGQSSLEKQTQPNADVSTNPFSHVG